MTPYSHQYRIDEVIDREPFQFNLTAEVWAEIKKSQLSATPFRSLSKNVEFRKLDHGGLFDLSIWEDDDLKSIAKFKPLWIGRSWYNDLIVMMIDPTLQSSGYASQILFNYVWSFNEPLLISGKISDTYLKWLLKLFNDHLGMGFDSIDTFSGKQNDFDVSDLEDPKMSIVIDSKKTDPFVLETAENKLWIYRRGMFDGMF